MTFNSLYQGACVCCDLGQQEIYNWVLVLAIINMMMSLD